MDWRELKQLQNERRRLAALEEQLQCSGALPGTRIHDVLQEHKRRLEARYRRALQLAGSAEPPAEDTPSPRSRRVTW